MTDNAFETWRKSSYSAQEGACVEVALAAARFGLRDSKNPVGPVLAVAAGQGHAFLAAIKREQISAT